MYSILFVCHGNICRSPMAEFVMRECLRMRDMSDRVHVESAATSTEELGNPVHRGTRRILAAKGIDCTGKTARQMTRADYEAFDMLIGMDDENVRRMRGICGGDPDGKISKLLTYAGSSRSIADPWYTGDFETTYRDVKQGCEGLCDFLDSHGILNRQFT